MLTTQQALNKYPVANSQKLSPVVTIRNLRLPNIQLRVLKFLFITPQDADIQMQAYEKVMLNGISANAR